MRARPRASRCQCRCPGPYRHARSLSATRLVEGHSPDHVRPALGAGVPEFVGLSVGEVNDMASSLEAAISPLFEGRNYCPISCLDLCHHFSEDDIGTLDEVAVRQLRSSVEPSGPAGRRVDEHAGWVCHVFSATDPNVSIIAAPTSCQTAFLAAPFLHRER